MNPDVDFYLFACGLEDVNTAHVPLSRDEPTQLGRRTLTQLEIRSTDNYKKLNVSRKQVLLTPYGARTFFAKATGLNAVIVNKGGIDTVLTPNTDKDSAVIRTGDKISLLRDEFTFQLAEKPRDGHPQLKRKLPEEKEDDRKENIPVTVSKTTPEAKKMKDFIGKPVKLWDSVKRIWMKGLVMKYDAETAEALVDFEGECMWKPASHLFLEETIMRIKERDLKKSMKKKKQRQDGSKRRKQDQGNFDRSTRSRRGVVYTEWISSSEESSGSEGVFNEDPPSEGEIDGIKIVRKRSYPGETMVHLEQLADKPTVIFYSDECMQHFVPKWHYEKPERLKSIMEGLTELASRYPSNLKIISDITPLTKEDLVLAHTKTYIEKVEKMVPTTDLPTHVTQYTQETDLRDPEEDFDTFMSKSSWRAILIACGAVRLGIDMVTRKEIRNCFCAIRPPGHHCGASGHTEGATSQGYCIMNNVALGALYAQKVHNYKRIAIVDFDVHHGNGTEELLAGKEGFLFISIHAGDIYPRTGYNNTPRASNVVNVALEVGDGSQAFHQAFDSKIIPALKNYKPDILFISAGFDAHKRDPTEGLSLEEKDYFIMTEKLKVVAENCCEGRLVSVLEGGYHLPSLRKSVREHLISLIKK